MVTRMSPMDTWAFPVGDALGPGHLSCVKAAVGRCRTQFHIMEGQDNPQSALPSEVRGAGCRARDMEGVTPRRVATRCPCPRFPTVPRHSHPLSTAGTESMPGAKKELEEFRFI